MKNNFEDDNAMAGHCRAIMISHEVPMCLLPQAREISDYDYCLVHLFDDPIIGEEYYNFFKDSLAQGRQVILDNSLYEVGDSFDPERYLMWIERLKPTYYVIPDTFWDADDTMRKADKWFELYRANADDETKSRCKSLGVAQGRTYDDVVRCYRHLDKELGVDKIGFTFKFAENFIETMPIAEGLKDVVRIAPSLLQWAWIRPRMISELIASGVLNADKPHHLLGCALPQEIKEYYDSPRELGAVIETCDTSNPITSGMELKRYHADWGLSNFKSDIIIAEHMTDTLSQKQLECIGYNVAAYRKWNVDGTDFANWVASETIKIIK